MRLGYDPCMPISDIKEARQTIADFVANDYQVVFIKALAAHTGCTLGEAIKARREIREIVDSLKK